MDDGKRHEKPWIGFPSVAPFQNSERASSIGARLQWLDTTQGRWFSAPFSRPTFLEKGIYEGLLVTLEDSHDAHPAP